MGWWFGRKSAPEQTRSLAPAWLSRTDGEEGFAVGYSSQFDEIYRRNPVGQRAVRLLSGLLGSLPIYAVEGDATAVKLVREDGLLENIGAALLLHGNAYVQLLADADEKPVELVFLRPERVTVDTDIRGWTTGYLYKIANNVTRIAKTDGLGRMQVAHLRSLSPRDDHYGMGCMDAAIAAASIHNRASRWNKGLLDNAARPSGAMSYEPGDGSLLSAEQFDRLKSELEIGFSGTGNADTSSSSRNRRLSTTGGRPDITGSCNLSCAIRIGS